MFFGLWKMLVLFLFPLTELQFYRCTRVECILNNLNKIIYITILLTPSLYPPYKGGNFFWCTADDHFHPLTSLHAESRPAAYALYRAAWGAAVSLLPPPAAYGKILSVERG